MHNKLPVPERLFRIGLRQGPYCQYCIGAEVADVEHFFCSCVRSRQAWSWMRLKILDMCDHGLMCSNWELINLILPASHFEQEIVWLIGNFVGYIWKNVFIRNSEVKLEKLFGYLTFKYKLDQQLHGAALGQIRGLS